METKQKLSKSTEDEKGSQCDFDFLTPLTLHFPDFIVVAYVKHTN